MMSRLQSSMHLFSLKKNPFKEKIDFYVELEKMGEMILTHFCYIIIIIIWFRNAAEGPLIGILGYTDDDVVSSDFIGDSRYTNWQNHFFLLPSH